ncbi:MAG TPA: exodeoxyribonuclease VII large subunit [Pirellulaceae bacterium]|nr:exodeoxyribonuclease VII large subunit [Pirellulaceae bacterium]
MASLYPLFDERPEGQVKILTVSQLSQLIEGTLESVFQSLWVSGEISEVSRPHSGHVYFTLRDEAAQIRAVVWRSAASRMRFQLEDGQQVICHGDIDVYPPRGTYQLVVRQVEPQGLGALQLAFKQLQRRLAAEGLFDPARKRPLPPFPRRVGFVTSPTGAAIRDFLEVAARRFRGVKIVVIPVRVQGEGAAAEVARGIGLANRLQPPLDVLVVGRGGGSLEDLWCFNEEIVVRAIVASQVPVVSAVGHEIDVTLADLAADVRALTPSEAAERVIPSAEELTARLAAFQRRIVAMLRARATAARRHVEQLARSRVLRNPKAIIYDLSHRLDELDEYALRAIRRRLQSSRDQIGAIACRAEALSPLAVLGRRYSMTTRAADGTLIQAADQVAIGDQVLTRLSRGEFRSIVTDTK